MLKATMEGPMKQDQLKLVTFGTSLFCEKARWALDWHGIAYEEISWPPGLHQILAKGCGAKATTLPILLDGKEVIQGSGAIIDWADQRSQDRNRKLTLGDALKIECRADDVLGVHVRRLAYAEMLPRFPHMAKPGLFRNASPSHRMIGNMMWPVTRRAMMQKYEITPEAAAESRAKLEAELDWLESQLADGRAYLVGDRFSRADLTVSSLLAPFACPGEIPAFRESVFPDALVADSERWGRRPLMRWVAEQYEAHRAPRRIAA
jgi:glutathione S-transferase